MDCYSIGWTAFIPLHSKIHILYFYPSLRFLQQVICYLSMSLIALIMGPIIFLIGHDIMKYLARYLQHSNQNLHSRVRSAVIPIFKSTALESIYNISKRDKFDQIENKVIPIKPPISIYRTSTEINFFRSPNLDSLRIKESQVLCQSVSC